MEEEYNIYKYVAEKISDTKELTRELHTQMRESKTKFTSYYLFIYFMGRNILLFCPNPQKFPNNVELELDNMAKGSGLKKGIYEKGDYQ